MSDSNSDRVKKDSSTKPKASEPKAGSSKETSHMSDSNSDRGKKDSSTKRKASEPKAGSSKETSHMSDSHSDRGKKDSSTKRKASEPKAGSSKETSHMSDSNSDRGKKDSSTKSKASEPKAGSSKETSHMSDPNSDRGKKDSSTKRKASEPKAGSSKETSHSSGKRPKPDDVDPSKEGSTYSEEAGDDDMDYEEGSSYSEEASDDEEESASGEESPGDTVDEANNAYTVRYPDDPEEGSDEKMEETPRKPEKKTVIKYSVQRGIIAITVHGPDVVKITLTLSDDSYKNRIEMKTRGDYTVSLMHKDMHLTGSPFVFTNNIGPIQGNKAQQPMVNIETFHKILNQVKLNIPIAFESWERWDQYLIQDEKKVVLLICKPTVREILRSYLDTEHQKLDDDNYRISKKVAGAILLTFDNCLHSVLYEEELDQYNNLDVIFENDPPSALYGGHHLIRLLMYWPREHFSNRPDIKAKFQAIMEYVATHVVPTFNDTDYV